MAQVKPSLTLDVNVGPSSHAGIGGSGTSMTPRAHQNAVNQKALAQLQASAYAPQSYDEDHRSAYVADSVDADQQDNSGFSSDDDTQDAYAAATSRLKAGSSSAGSKATRDAAHGGPQNTYQQQHQHPQSIHTDDDQESSSSTETDEYGQGRAETQDLQEDAIYEEEESDDGEEMEDDESQISSSPSIPDENIDFDLVYALHNFVATVEGQATVHKGNSLTLLDDSNSYWWLVRVLRTQEVGYIPAENIETPFERLARLNKHRNVDLTSATQDDHDQVPDQVHTSHLVKSRHATGDMGLSAHSGKLSALSRRAYGAPAQAKDQRRLKRGVIFGPPTYLEHSGDEYSDYDEEGEDETMEYEEDPDAIYEDDEEHDEEEDDEQYEQDGSEDVTPNALNGMEPDDGMEWDGGEAERIQQQHEAALTAAGDHTAQNASDRDVQHAQGWQQQPEPAQQTLPPAYIDDDDSQDRGTQQHGLSKSDEHSHLGGVADADGWSSPQPDVVSAANGPLQTSPQTSQQPRSASAERLASGVDSHGSQYISNAAAGSSQMSRNSTMSNSSFLPSQIQRERANSDVSATSSNMLSPEKDKWRNSRSSKGNDSVESTDEKTGKKRSGVFSLFSRKDKKDRKSVLSEEDRDSLVGRTSEDSFAGNSRGRNSPATTGNPIIIVPDVEPAVQAANASLPQGQSIGMGRAVQERDRAQQEAYQRQFLSIRSTSANSQSGEWSQAGERRKSPRPGSLIGPSGSTPMLSVLRVFAGDGVESESTFKTVLLNDTTSSKDLQRQALQRFGVPLHDVSKYVLTIKRLEGDERPLDDDEHPLELFNNLTNILQEGQVTVPSVKRSSVGSISSISSNLSSHPAIARLGNDFSDDHAVKFYISRRDRLNGYVDIGDSIAGDMSNRTYNITDVSASQDTSEATLQSFNGATAARSSHSSIMSNDPAETVQGPTARFSLRLIIYAPDLPGSMVFDPQSNALIPSSALKERPSQGGQGSVQQQQYREKILTFPRNTTVAEVVEEGLDRFGIAEGVVEGGDDVEDRPSRRKGRLHVKYGLVVRDSSGDRSLHATSRILEAYQSPPTFKLGVSKRRSIDAAALLGASNDIGPNDPVFVLRQMASSQKTKPEGLALRTLSPTENALASKRRSMTSPALSPRISSSRDLGSSSAPDGQMRQSIIAAQRAAAAERNAAVLGAQKNGQDGVDVMLSNRARIRSSKLGTSNRYRYSYLPADGQERDISSIVEEVLNDQNSRDSNFTSSRDTSLHPRDATRPTYGVKNRMQSDMTIDDYASARSSSRGNSPLSLNEVHFDLRNESSAVAPLSLNKQGTPADSNGFPIESQYEGDLLKGLIKKDPRSSAVAVDDRINDVLHRVQSPAMAVESATNTPRAESREETSASPVISTAAKVGAGAVAVGIGAAALVVGAAKLATNAIVGQDSQGDDVSATPKASREVAGPAKDDHATTPGVLFAPLSAPSTSKALPRADSRSEKLPSSASMLFGADDASLSHLYTIVDAAARRDPRKQRLMSHASMSSIASVASPILGSPNGGMGSRPGSKLSTFRSLPEDDTDALKMEPGGLFAPNIPFMEDKKLREAYSGISRELGSIDDGLDQLLADIIRIF